MSDEPRHVCSEHAAAIAAINQRLNDGDRRFSEQREEYRTDVQEIKKDVKDLILKINTLATERRTIASVAGITGGFALWVLQCLWTSFRGK